MTPPTPQGKPPYMSAADVRRAFLEFFQSRGPVSDTHLTLPTI